MAVLGSSPYSPWGEGVDASFTSLALLSLVAPSSSDSSREAPSTWIARRPVRPEGKLIGPPRLKEDNLWSHDYRDVFTFVVRKVFVYPAT